MDEQPQAGLVTVMLMPDLRRRLVRLSKDDMLVLMLRRTCRYLHAHLPYDPLGCPATLLDVLMGGRTDRRGYSPTALSLIVRHGMVHAALREGDVAWAYAMISYMATLSDILEAKRVIPEATLFRFLYEINKNANADPAARRRLMAHVTIKKWPFETLWRESSRVARIVGYWRCQLLVASGAYTATQAADIVCGAATGDDADAIVPVNGTELEFDVSDI
jgi:hypothetical protein